MTDFPSYPETEIHFVSGLKSLSGLRVLAPCQSDFLYDAAEEMKRLIGHAQTLAVPDRERIARAICCPSGCSYRGDSEDGEKCYCDTSDFHGSGIEKKTDAVLAALADTSTDRHCDDCDNRGCELFGCALTSPDRTSK